MAFNFLPAGAPISSSDRVRPEGVRAETFLPPEYTSATDRLNKFLSNPLANISSILGPLMAQLAPGEARARGSLRDQFRMAGSLEDSTYGNEARNLERDILGQRSATGVQAGLQYMAPLLQGYAASIPGPLSREYNPLQNFMNLGGSDIGIGGAGGGGGGGFGGGGGRLPSGPFSPFGAPTGGGGAGFSGATQADIDRGILERGDQASRWLQEYGWGGMLSNRSPGQEQIYFNPDFGFTNTNPSLSNNAAFGNYYNEGSEY